MKKMKLNRLLLIPILSCVCACSSINNNKLEKTCYDFVIDYSKNFTTTNPYDEFELTIKHRYKQYYEANYYYSYVDDDDLYYCAMLLETKDNRVIAYKVLEKYLLNSGLFVIDDKE